MEKTRFEKSGFPPRAAISGVIRSLISACTTLLNATPTTTATERSTRLLRTRNFLNPLIHPPSAAPGAAAQGRRRVGDKLLPYRPRALAAATPASPPAPPGPTVNPGAPGARDDGCSAWPGREGGWMIKLALIVVGVLVALVGAVFTLQGLGYIGGSFMTGATLWAIIGPVVLLAGLAMVAVALRGRRRVR